MKFGRIRIYLLLISVVILGTGIVIGYAFASSRNPRAASFFGMVGPIRSAEGGFKLIDPLIAYETPEATPLTEYAALKKKLQGVINGARAAKAANDVSVYYRDLSTGRWIAIERSTTFYPASLLKVPVMIAYFRKSESDPSIMDQRVMYEPIGSGNTFEAPSLLKAGTMYTIKQLIEHMIVDSDNGATYTLLSKIDPALLSEVYTDLGIKDPGDDSSSYEISTKTYALFFRVLYNATYLSPADSEEALKLLLKTTYTDGLAAGVPAGIQVAHKYGEHILNVGDTVRGVELHDCGVVYRPEHPYILCVMTRASDLHSATTIISSISKTVYDSTDTK